MRLRFWNAGIAIFLFAIVAAAGPAAAQSFSDRSDAQFALLGPRIESGLYWIVEQNRDDALCRLTDNEIRKKLRKSSSAVVAAAFEILREARVRCEARKLGIDTGFIRGANFSVGVGGSFGLNSTTETTSIGSAGVYDPIGDGRKVGINASGVVGKIGFGYDWSLNALLSKKSLGSANYGMFIGVNADVTFGGGTKDVWGVPGIVPFIPAGVATMDRLRFRNDVSLDFTARVGTYVSPNTAVYGLGGITTSYLTFKYDCSADGFCGAAPATPAFSTETSKWATGGVIGAGVEVKGDFFKNLYPTGYQALSLYFEYRAHLLPKILLDVGTLPTRSTTQEVDMSYQTIIGGARIRF